ncbi:hypothetical protein [uncultured Umboniibacter sp.]|uniref:hypothetical protein n=1 Tax=uncultured Umboniibacter sp. TaxID=1798917 RepID=UPI00261A682D|nr:hypothetical protein [uncultured Umboniibacter sp.]
MSANNFSQSTNAKPIAKAFQPYLYWSESLSLSTSQAAWQRGVMLFETQIRQPLGSDFLQLDDAARRRRISHRLAKMLPCGEAKRWGRDRLIAVITQDKYWALDSFGEHKLGEYEAREKIG